MLRLKANSVPLLFLAASSMAMHTWTEVRRMFQPIGSDTWTYDLGLKHGMRDGLTCPVGGRWVVAFWSRRELSNIVTQPLRIMICAAASFAALRLEQLAGPDPKIFGQHACLTPRELAVLRLVSKGTRSREIAEELGLGEENDPQPSEKGSEQARRSQPNPGRRRGLAARSEEHTSELKSLRHIVCG